MAAGIYADGTTPYELHYIIPIENLRSVFENGILSHKRAGRHGHADVSAAAVQERRGRKIVPNPDRAEKKSLRIHRHVNLYLNAHNAMMFKVATDGKKFDPSKAQKICVLRINPAILGREEVVIADQNAATDDADFHQARTFTFDRVHTAVLKGGVAYWGKDRAAETNKKIRQAEVLVPYKLNPSYIMGMYACDAVAQRAIEGEFEEAVPVPISLHPSLFYRIPAGQFPPRLVAPINPSPPHNDAYPDLDEALPTSSSSGSGSG